MRQCRTHFPKTKYGWLKDAIATIIIVGILCSLIWAFVQP